MGRIPGIQYKSVTTQAHASEVPTSSGEMGDGMIEAIVSVTGIKDNVGDVIMPGAYEKTLGHRKPKGVWSHQWENPIAKTHEVKELPPGDPRLPEKLPNGDPWPSEAGALYVKMEFNLQTERGRTAYEDVKFFGDSQEWSIGFKVPERKAVRKNGIRYISELDLFEYSPVLFGAMSNARTTQPTTVKGAQLAYKSLRDGTESHRRESRMSMQEIKSAMSDFMDSFQNLVTAISDMTGEQKDADRAEVLEASEELGLASEDLEEFFDAVDDEDEDAAGEKALSLAGDLEEKGGLAAATILSYLSDELSAIESKGIEDDDEDEEFEDEDEEFDDLEEEEDDDEEKSGENGTETKTIPLDQLNALLN